jgi:hypothetical protein
MNVTSQVRAVSANRASQADFQAATVITETAGSFHGTTLLIALLASRVIWRQDRDTEQPIGITASYMADWKRVQDALHASEHDLRLIIDSIPGFV